MDGMDALRIKKDVLRQGCFSRIDVGADTNIPYVSNCLRHNLSFLADKINGFPPFSLPEPPVKSETKFENNFCVELDLVPVKPDDPRWNSSQENAKKSNAFKFYRSAASVPTAGEGADFIAFARICQEIFIQPREI